MACNKLNYSEVFKCSLQDQEEFIPLRSRLSLLSIFIVSMDLFLTFKEGFGTIISVLFSCKMKECFLA